MQKAQLASLARQLRATAQTITRSVKDENISPFEWIAISAQLTACGTMAAAAAKELIKGTMTGHSLDED